MNLTRYAVAAAIAFATAGAPVLAQSAAPLSVAASAQRSGPRTGNASQFWNKDDYWVPLGIFAAVIIAIIVLHKDGTRDLPRSA
ncbi:MAG TPA: hypothetical protein VGW40_02610 [Allosphingosinicella sp.]|nr:hypothetical protein [Allosphingosinicella sp.]